MKVLWITNILFPDVCDKLKIAIPIGGGWMYSGAKSLLKIDSSIEMAVAALYDGDVIQHHKIGGINYYIIPRKTKANNYPKYLEKYWQFIVSNFKPEIIHIHGTEYPHVYSFIKACGIKNVVISIQGILNNYQDYYFGGISLKSLIINTTIRDVVRMDSFFHQMKNMKLRAKYEIKAISEVVHVIGRTHYDLANTWAINTTLNYHFNNEILQDPFYLGKWSIHNCELYSIFLSQAHYPIKGFHKMLEAFPIVLREFPKAKIIVASKNIFLKPFYLLNGYEKYILNLIKKYQLKDKINFIGTVDAEQMRDQYLKSHIFVCPSAIENSSNSISEAQILGVPTVASYVGGMKDLIVDGETGLLYRFEEVNILAKNICIIFSDIKLAALISENAYAVAHYRHSPFRNSEKLLEIYKKIRSSE